MVIIMPCYYNQEPPIFDMRGTNDGGGVDEDEGDVGRVTYLTFSNLYTYGLVVIECMEFHWYYSGCPH